MMCKTLLLRCKHMSELIYYLYCFTVINETAQWKRLEEHATAVKQTHLRNLMQDRERCFALMAEHKGILLDYSRQNMLPETMVRLTIVLRLFTNVTNSTIALLGHAF